MARSWFKCVSMGMLGLAIVSATAQGPGRRLVYQVAPEYPLVLGEKMIRGIVRVRVTVRPDGLVREKH
jgi:hypothetical protein